VRIGLGYINGVREEEARALVAERERGGPYRGVADLASRSGMGRDGLERLAWAEALRGMTGQDRRVALWRLGISRGAQRVPVGTQLSLPVEPPAAPELPDVGEWEALLADYRTTGMTLGAHPLQLLRPELGEAVVLSSDLSGIADGTRLEVAGMVVARQRPATARGVVFMLIEDEAGQVNLVLPPPVFERYRGVARTAPMLKVRGKLERRDGVINVLVSELSRLERPDLPLAEVRTIEPVPGQELGRDASGREIEPVTEIQAVAPAAHSFGRRGR
jgi:error-prone DNA polymerase